MISSTQPVNPKWQEFWDKVKDDPKYFLDDFEVSDIEEDIPEVYSDDEFEKPDKDKEIEEDIKVEEL